MRKRLIPPHPESIRTRGEDWLDVERLAVVEVTSEDRDYPVESAFVASGARLACSRAGDPDNSVGLR
jgi:hypothetical protein